VKAGFLAGALFAIASLSVQRAHAVSCVFNSVSPVTFGAYNVFSETPTDAVGSLTYQCSLLLALDVITINLGTGSSGTYGARTMLNGANALNYNLYMDAARTQDGWHQQLRRAPEPDRRHAFDLRSHPRAPERQGRQLLGHRGDHSLILRRHSRLTRRRAMGHALCTWPCERSHREVLRGEI